LALSVEIGNPISLCWGPAPTRIACRISFRNSLCWGPKAPNNTNNDVTTKPSTSEPSTSEIQTKPTTPQESTKVLNVYLTFKYFLVKVILLLKIKQYASA
ncbi:hypothetical protein, partial [Staphylococcus aureus]